MTKPREVLLNGIPVSVGSVVAYRTSNGPSCPWTPIRLVTIKRIGANRAGLYVSIGGGDCYGLNTAILSADPADIEVIRAKQQAEAERRRAAEAAQAAREARRSYRLARAFRDWFEVNGCHRDAEEVERAFGESELERLTKALGLEVP